MLLIYKQYIELLLKRMRIIGLPNDLVNLVSVWLKQRSFVVYIDGNNSLLYHVLLGKVQGSVLGPVNYAIFFSPLFDLEDMSAFADDNYTIKWNKDLQIMKIFFERLE